MNKTKYLRYNLILTRDWSSYLLAVGLVAGAHQSNCYAAQLDHVGVGHTVKASCTTRTLLNQTIRDVFRYQDGEGEGGLILFVCGGGT